MTPESAVHDPTAAQEAMLNATHRKLMDGLVQTCTAVADGDIGATRGARRLAEICSVLREVARTKRAISRTRRRERREELGTNVASRARM